MREMKILHTADNHLGREAFSLVDPRSGVNLRGLDYLESFKNVCKIALNEKVDLFIIAGDMFDNSQPDQYYIIESMRMLKRVSKAGITTLIINGNTDISKNHNPLAYLAEIDNVFVVTQPNTFVLGSYDVVCIPYSTQNFAQTLEQTLTLSPSENKILVSHVSLSTAIQGSEISENIIADQSLIPDRFAYVALGHMHKFQQIEHSIPVFYCGSTERFDFSEEDEDKYALLVEINGDVTVKPYKLPTRSMHSFDLDCLNLKTNEILSKINNIVEEDSENIQNAIIKLLMYNLDVNEQKNLDLYKIKEKFSNAFECVIEIKTKKEKVIEGVSIPTLEEELDARLSKLQSSKVRNIAKKIIERI